MGLGAIIGGGLSLVGSLVGGHSANHAADKAADTSLQVAQQNNALAKDIYGQNQQALSPYVQRGNAAGNALNSFLGLGGPAMVPTASLPTQQPMQPQNAFAGYGGNPYKTAMLDGYRNDNGVNGGMAPQLAAQSGGAATGYNPQDAFHNYIANSDYGFQFGQGANQVNSGYAGQGTLQSGAAMKALEDYRQNLQSGYRNEYLGYLGQQQSAGLSGASALAGVGNNYVANVSANNNSAGTAAANAILAKGSNNPFANALGGIGGYMLGRY